MNNTLGITSHEEHTNPGGKKKHPAIHIRHNIKDHTIYIKYEYTHIKKTKQIKKQKQTNKQQQTKNKHAIENTYRLRRKCFI